MNHWFSGGDGRPLLQLKVKPLVNDSYVGQMTMMDCPSGLCATSVRGGQ